VSEPLMGDGFQFPEPVYIHRLFAGLQEVVEIGGSFHNPYHSVSRVVGRYRNIAWDPRGDFARYDQEFAGAVLPIDIHAEAMNLPLEDNSVDALIASHVLEHLWDPIGALLEWLRVVRPAEDGENGQLGQPTAHGGYVYLVIPDKDRMTGERCTDREADPTPITVLTDRHLGHIPPPDDLDNTMHHRSFWTPDSFREFLHWMQLSRSWLFTTPFTVEAFMARDENVGNGHVHVLRKLAS